MAATPLTLVLDFWQEWDSEDPKRPAVGLQPGTQVWINDKRMGPIVGFWTGERFRTYDTSDVKVTHWALLTPPSREEPVDFWHDYADLTPVTRPELEEWEPVWIDDPLHGVNFGYWTGHAFRDYTKTPVRARRWAYLTKPSAPPAAVEKQAS